MLPALLYEEKSEHIFAYRGRNLDKRTYVYYNGCQYTNETETG